MMEPVGATSTGVWRLTRTTPPPPHPITAAMGVHDGLFTLHHGVISGTFLCALQDTRRFIRQTGWILSIAAATLDGTSRGFSKFVYWSELSDGSLEAGGRRRAGNEKKKKTQRERHIVMQAIFECEKK